MFSFMPLSIKICTFYLTRYIYIYIYSSLPNKVCAFSNSESMFFLDLDDGYFQIFYLFIFNV